MASSTARLRNRSRAPEEYVRRAANDDLDVLLAVPEEADPPPLPKLLTNPPEPVGEDERGEGDEITLARFIPRDRTRGLSAALPNELDVALAAYELEEAQAGRRRTRIAIVEEALQRLPEDLDDLVALVAGVAPSLHPDVPARGFSVRVRPEVSERLAHLALRLYQERGLRRVTHRALAIAALKQLLDSAGVQL
jgi:hypothetical protein